MLAIFLIDPSPKYPQYDYQTWYFWTRGEHLRLGRVLGEWAWVGRVDYLNAELTGAKLTTGPC